MAFGIGRALTAPLAVINFILYFISACLAGSILNHNFDHSGSGFIGNGVTTAFLIFALVASIVGMASTLTGAYHLSLWRPETHATAVVTAALAWLFTLLAMGVASKEIHTGGPRPKRLKTLEALMIILAFLELLYLLATFAGSVPREGYANSGTPALKTPHHGTTAAAAV